MRYVLGFIFGMIGVTFAGTFGLFGGFFLGYFLGRWASKAAVLETVFAAELGRRPRRETPRKEVHISDVAFDALFQVAGYIAKSDGRVSEQEIRIAETAMRLMHLDETTRLRAISGFKAGTATDFELEPVLNDVRLAFDRSSEVGYVLLRILADMALADGVSPVKQDVLMGFADAFHLDPGVAEDLLRRHRRSSGRFHAGRRDQHGDAHTQDRSRQARHAEGTMSLDRAYERLGVLPTHSGAEIQLAYRKLIKEHHPDRLLSKGLPPQLLERANELTREIQDAWETVKTARQIR